MDYDVLIIGAGPGGIFTAYELTQKARKELKIAVFELGNPLNRRKCPIDGDKIKSCIRCKTCSIKNQELHPLQNMLHHERVRRGRRFFGR